jgi:hypothetical protein
MLARMGRFAQTRWARMSGGQYCLIRDLGLVKGGKGLRHHEVVLTLSWRGILRFVLAVAREWRDAGSGLSWISRNSISRNWISRYWMLRHWMSRAPRHLRKEPQAASEQSLHQPDVAA